MKRITFNKPIEEGGPRIRNNKDSLISDIADRCVTRNEEEKKKLRKCLALWANTIRATEMDLHALLKKKDDPSIRNYTAFVWWSIKMKKK